MIKRSACFLRVIIALAGFFVGTYASAGTVVYEDAEDGAVHRWTVYDASPQGAVISNVADADQNSNVISLSGSGTSNGYMLGNLQGSPGAWNNFQEKNIEWSMKFNEFFYIYISVQTQNGHRYLFYSNRETNNTYTQVNGGTTYIHYGLGSTSSNGSWQTFTRDLDADLKTFEAANSIQTINAFLVRGSGSIDNVKLFDTSSTNNIYEDAEDGNTTGWTIYDKSPVGATINNVFDTEKNNQVIELMGDSTANGYMLGNRSGKQGAWNNTQARTMQWSMKYLESFYIYINMQTQNGERYLFYTNAATSNSYAETNGGVQYIHYGLGSDASSGIWQTYTRNLQNDLAAFEPGNSIVSVDAFLVRGSGKVDDISLDDNLTAQRGGDVSYEDAEDSLTSRWRVYDQAPAGAVINNVFDSDKNSRVIELVGSGVSNGYMLGDLPGKQGAWNQTENFLIEWSMNFSENYLIYVVAQTEKGVRYITYMPSDTDAGFNEPYIQYGLGTTSNNGTWRTVTRHLQADLTRYEPDNKIISVNTFLVRGTGKLDDVRMKDSTKEAGLLLSFDDKSVELWYDYFMGKDSSIKVTFFVHGWHTLSADQIQKLHTLESWGHEIAFHSYSHKGAIRNYGGDSGLQAYIDEEIVRGLNDMQAAGFNPVSFAYPYGEHTPNYDLALYEYFPYLRTTTYDAPRGTVVELDSIFTHIDRLDRLFSGEGIGNVSGNDNAELEIAFERAKNNREIISIVGHFIHPDDHPDAGNRLTIRASELDQLIAIAQSKGLRLYTMKEVFED
ncbi:MAG: Parallel beta-helix repeat [uncultured Thiotrichaceae bacterium]|uniref:Parallel beta-helix repeat n=1 Tax=uncultured Thiotrichaceae bacterium TaxID=298394 RepID=A0A6S6SSN7_9GAMM|nr:MAG: Parallel beta-helix repeat [uncultured Thiotrichaceae bacterium]